MDFTKREAALFVFVFVGAYFAHQAVMSDLFWTFEFVTSRVVLPLSLLTLAGLFWPVVAWAVGFIQGDQKQ